MAIWPSSDCRVALNTIEISDYFYYCYYLWNAWDNINVVANGTAMCAVCAHRLTGECGSACNVHAQNPIDETLNDARNITVLYTNQMYGKTPFKHINAAEWYYFRWKFRYTFSEMQTQTMRVLHRHDYPIIHSKHEKTTTTISASAKRRRQTQTTTWNSGLYVARDFVVVFIFLLSSSFCFMQVVGHVLFALDTEHRITNRKQNIILCVCVCVSGWVHVENLNKNKQQEIHLFRSLPLSLPFHSPLIQYYLTLFGAQRLLIRKLLANKKLDRKRAERGVKYK